MHDQVAVRMLDRRAYREEQFETLGDAASPLVAVLVDGKAFDELHHEVRQALVCGAGVEELRDVRVLQAGEDLSLRAEAPGEHVAVRAAPDRLDRDPVRDMAIRAFRLVDRTHPSLSDPPGQAIRPQRPADERRGHMFVVARLVRQLWGTIESLTGVLRR